MFSQYSRVYCSLILAGMKLLYIGDLMYQPGDKIGEDITSVQIFHSLQILHEQFSSNLIIIVLCIECC